MCTKAMMVKRSSDKKRGNAKKLSVDNLVSCDSLNHINQSRAIISALDARLEDIERRGRSRKKRGNLTTRAPSKRSTSAPSKQISAKRCFSKQSLERSATPKSVRFFSGVFPNPRMPHLAQRSSPPRYRKSALKNEGLNSGNNKSSPTPSSTSLAESCSMTSSCRHGVCPSTVVYHCGCMNNLMPCGTCPPSGSLTSCHHGNNNNTAVGPGLVMRCQQVPYNNSCTWQPPYNNSLDSWKYDMKLNDLKFKYSDYNWSSQPRVRAHSLPRDPLSLDRKWSFGDRGAAKYPCQGLPSWMKPSVLATPSALSANSNANHNMFSKYADVVGKHYSPVQTKASYGYGKLGMTESISAVANNANQFHSMTPKRVSNYRMEFESKDRSTLNYFKDSTASSFQCNFCPSATGKTLDEYCQAYKKHDFSDDMRLMGKASTTDVNPSHALKAQPARETSKNSPPRTLSRDANVHSDLANDLKTMDICRRALREQREKELFLLEKYVYGAHKSDNPYSNPCLSDRLYDGYRSRLWYLSRHNINKEAFNNYSSNKPATETENSATESLAGGAEGGGTSSKPNYNSASELVLSQHIRKATTPTSSYSRQSVEDSSRLIYKYGKEKMSDASRLSYGISSSNNNTKSYSWAKSERAGSRFFDQLKFPTTPASYHRPPEFGKSWSLDRKSSKEHMRELLDRYGTLAHHSSAERGEGQGRTMVHGLSGKDFNLSNQSKDVAGSGVKKDYSSTITRNLSAPRLCEGLCDPHSFSSKTPRLGLQCEDKGIIRALSASRLTDRDCWAGDKSRSQTRPQHPSLESAHPQMDFAPSSMSGKNEYMSEFLNQEQKKKCGAAEKFAAGSECVCGICSAPSPLQVEKAIDKETDRFINLSAVIYKSMHPMPSKPFEPLLQCQDTQTENHGSSCHQ